MDFEGKTYTDSYGKEKLFNENFITEDISLIPCYSTVVNIQLSEVPITLEIVPKYQQKTTFQNQEAKMASILKSFQITQSIKNPLNIIFC